MTPSAAELAVFDGAMSLLSQRSESYGTGVQTSVCWKTSSGWVNLLTKLEFIRKGEHAPKVLGHRYREIAILRRLLSPSEVAALVKRVVVGACLGLWFSAMVLPSGDHRGLSSRISGVLVRLMTSPPSLGIAKRSHSSFPPVSC
jgi:hypothetical protein